jgi:hypothetical protein
LSAAATEPPISPTPTTRTEAKGDGGGEDDEGDGGEGDEDDDGGEGDDTEEENTGSIVTLFPEKALIISWYTI